MALNVVPSEPSGLADAKRIGPEDMQTIRAQGSQAQSCIRHSRARARIRRIGQYANQRVLGERATRPSSTAIAPEPCVRRLVMQMGRIEQRNQDIYVEQSDHARPRCLRFVAEPVDDFGSDDPRPSLLGQDRHAVAFARSASSRCESATRQLGKDAPRRSTAPCRELLGALENVLVDVQCGPHAMIITHQTSQVKERRTGSLARWTGRRAAGRSGRYAA